MGKVKRPLTLKNDESKRKKMKKAAKNIPANEDAFQMDEVLPVDDDADEEPIFGDRVAAKKGSKQISKKASAAAAQSNEAKPSKTEAKDEISPFADFDFDDRLLKVSLFMGNKE
jgi:hypothetical protein